ncbi:MAG: hypothetical protein H6719_21980 [Sandaracinaceae bacterium]|nr:hypothetical protein [Sandaracinaceae bacterium]
MRVVVVAAVVAASLVAAPALAQPALRRPTVERVITATADARDAARIGDRVYVATEGGLLVLKDGRVERRYGPTDGLPGARLRSVSVVDGELWIGAVEGTARATVGEDGLHVTETHDVRRVRRVARFGDAIWLASYGGGLHRLRDGHLEPVSLGAAHAYVRLTDLLVHDGELWVATQGVGILRVGEDGRVRSRIRQGDGLASHYLWRLAPAGDRVLVTSIAGLSVVGPAGVERGHAWTASARRLPVRDLRAAVVVDDTLWLGTYGRGLYRASTRGGRVHAVTGTGPVHALVADGAGVLVAHEQGLARASESRATPIVEGGLSTGDVTALANAFGTLWVGTFGHGLARMHRGELVPVATERWSLDRRINDLAVSGRGASQRLWIATDRGLWWHDGRVFSRVEDPSGPSWIHTTSLDVDRHGAVWVTTGREVCRYQSDRWRCWTGDATFPVAQLHAVTTDAEGRVWVGGLHGLYELDPRTDRFTRHTVSSGDLPVDWVTAVVPWGRGVMAGTYHGGLAIGDGARFTTVAEGPGGLPSGWVNPHAIRRIGDDVWIGTLERGLVVGRPGAWQHLTTADGLPSDDVTDVLADASGVWVATRGGLARVAR